MAQLFDGTTIPGLKLVRKRRADGTIRTFYCHRATKLALGSDLVNAVACAAAIVDEPSTLRTCQRTDAGRGTMLVKERACVARDEIRHRPRPVTATSSARARMDRQSQHKHRP
jgi:hypothetical protein